MHFMFESNFWNNISFTFQTTHNAINADPSAHVICGLSFAWIMGSDPTEGMDGVSCVCCELCTASAMI